MGKKTDEHIAAVQRHMETILKNLRNRSMVHDASKLRPPESDVFDDVSERLSKLTYGSEEYRNERVKLLPAIIHHYENNSHHPEHYENGISGMSLMDVVEMFADWLAAAENNNGDILNSIAVGRDRFGMDGQLHAILTNTVAELSGN